ncbi:hypothetical protein [Kiloniella sp.]|uniref:hypothetical protein n=1 Tax=Kiloniella sp. TaxID=1938587 RepID=UPI003B0204FA
MKPKELANEILEVFEGLCYVLDLEGNILHVGTRRWNSFADDNSAKDLTAEYVINKSIFDFISGDDVRKEIHQVLDELKGGEQSEWIMPYRCDSPDRKRNMRLSIASIKDDEIITGFIFQSITLDEEMRPPIDLFDFKAIENYLAKQRTLPLLRMCSFCERVRDSNITADNWTEAETYYAKGGSSQVRISHGICGMCREKSKDGYN